MSICGSRVSAIPRPMVKTHSSSELRVCGCVLALASQEANAPVVLHYALHRGRSTRPHPTVTPGGQPRDRSETSGLGRDPQMPRALRDGGLWLVGPAVALVPPCSPELLSGELVCYCVAEVPCGRASLCYVGNPAGWSGLRPALG